MSISPPFRLSWKSDQSLLSAVVGDEALYGVSDQGKVVSLAAGSGARRWVSSGTYLTNRLVRQDKRLFAYRVGEGLAIIDDLGGTFVEKVVASFQATLSANIATPVVDGDMVYLAINQGLYAYHQNLGLQFAAILSDVQPHTIALVSSRSLVAINGRGVPVRYSVGAEAFNLIWSGQPHGIDAGQSERPVIVAANRVIVGVGPDTVAYDLRTGRIAWRLGRVPALKFASLGSLIYAAFHGGAVWAIRPEDGVVVWQRQYMYDLDQQRDYGLMGAGNTLLYGGILARNPDGSISIALDPETGALKWVSRSATTLWSAGIPAVGGGRLFFYGAGHTGAYEGLSTPPVVSADQLLLTPVPVRGRASELGTGKVRFYLSAAARVSITAYRETEGLGTRIVSGADLTSGVHERSWSIAGTRGFTDSPQFGYILFDIEEFGGQKYTQAAVLPVNTFPDILWHWARHHIEVMVFHKYLNGYPDLTFQPNGLVTRAESSTVIAKTLELLRPSPGFQTKFADIEGHWAREYITALEERGIISGFAEPGGTFAFRPNQTMTRAEEARILVKAYKIPAAAPGFNTRFKDIKGHWAAPDILALEAAGHVTGFHEADGSFTYRPQQSLTRAELCAMIVRIRQLSK